MKIKDLQKNWNEFGELNPLWAVKTDKKNWDIKKFFETGEQEIKEVINYINSLNLKIPRGKALDFGCGVGRLSQALVNHFDEVCGIDIAKSMIDSANKYNKSKDKCKYFLNESDDLSLFEDNSFDFIYTNIVLQHIPDKKIIRNYLKEFLRILKPNGVLMFQLPSVPDYTWIKSILCKVRESIYYFCVNLGVSKKFCFSYLKLVPYMYMNHIASNEIKNLFFGKATILKIEKDKSVKTRYLIQKNTCSKLVRKMKK